ncbi:MAG: hypothetical protein IT384_29060 [Deltaproteobacteria bacterium]|nr:hypothetical protein [Deltaproteobacteria bacterium]
MSTSTISPALLRAAGFVAADQLEAISLAQVQDHRRDRGAQLTAANQRALDDLERQLTEIRNPVRVETEKLRESIRARVSQSRPELFAALSGDPSFERRVAAEVLAELSATELSACIGAGRDPSPLADEIGRAVANRLLNPQLSPADRSIFSASLGKTEFPLAELANALLRTPGGSASVVPHWRDEWSFKGLGEHPHLRSLVPLLAERFANDGAGMRRLERTSPERAEAYLSHHMLSVILGRIGGTDATRALVADFELAPIDLSSDCLTAPALFAVARSLTEELAQRLVEMLEVTHPLRPGEQDRRNTMLQVLVTALSVAGPRADVEALGCILQLIMARPRLFESATRTSRLIAALSRALENAGDTKAAAELAVKAVERALDEVGLPTAPNCTASWAGPALTSALEQLRRLDQQHTLPAEVLPRIELWALDAPASAVAKEWAQWKIGSGGVGGHFVRRRAQGQ